MIDFEECIKTLKRKRPVFISEADFQMELAWVIKEKYKSARVICEYTPSFAPEMHIDILVIMNGNWIPIELKYKTKGCTIDYDGVQFNLKNHGAKDVNCYLYLKDIRRIETIREEVPVFNEGYTLFLTNDESYLKTPRKGNCVYKEFAINQGNEKKGLMDWAEETGAGTKKGMEDPIILKNSYKMQWEEYSKVDNSKTGSFWYLLNKIMK